MSTRRAHEVTPSAARLTRSLRDVGYDFPSAVADLVDNSVSAGATEINVIVEFDGPDSRVFVADNGAGMSENALVEALRFGSRRDYGTADLGRYGLGLKTASLSHARSLTVATRRAASADRIFVRELDLDLIEEMDEWLVVAPRRSANIDRACSLLAESTGTVVLWRALDRVLPEKHPAGGRARRRLESLAAKTAEHLAVVFHRFLEGLPDGRLVTISVNGDKIRSWNPFAPNEENCRELPPQRFDLAVGEISGTVRLRRFVLPGRTRFSSQAEFERMSGPLKWNRQQGLYVFRADRLVQWGGWAGIRGIDEHTKLARASLDFDTSLDTVFNINVSKMRVAMPPQLRQMIEQGISDLCLTADAAYRRVPSGGRSMPLPAAAGPSAVATGDMKLAGLALRSAALQAGQYEALESILQIVRRDAPDVAVALGLSS